MDGLTNNSHRSQGTASDTGDPFNTEFSIRRGLTIGNLKLAFKIFKDNITRPDVTGRARADGALVLALRLEAEGFEEGRDSIDLD